MIEVKDEIPVTVENESCDSSETSEAESYSSSVDAVAERVDERDAVHVLDGETSDDFFKHKRTKVVHIAATDSKIEGVTLFICGRNLNNNYGSIPWVDRADPKCSLCFRDKRFVSEDQIH